VSEKALLFGEDKSLVGVITEPDESHEPTDRGVLILNAGVLHRVGPNRVHVQLARALASAGFAVLRFDFSGIGDSRQPGGAEPFVRRAVRETQQAMDFLGQARGVSEFLVMGICAGADNGLQAACQDPRVLGAALVDGYNLPSLRMLVYFYRWKLVNPLSWLRLASGRSQTWSLFRSVAVSRRSTREVLARAESMLPPPAQFLEQLQSLADRGTELLLVYTGVSPAYYNYRRLVRPALRSWPSRGRVRIEHMPESDHIFTLRANRDRVVHLLRDWAAGLPRAAPAARSAATPPSSWPA
jgi:pimeloyl-ACP methyl ester carboxylesterase